MSEKKSKRKHARKKEVLQSVKNAREKNISIVCKKQKKKAYEEKTVRKKR